MNRLEACKLIITKMTDVGFVDMIPADWADSWTEEEIDYHLVNYGESWLEPEDFMSHALYFKFMQENVN